MGREKGPRVGGAGARHAVGPGEVGGQPESGHSADPCREGLLIPRKYEFGGLCSQIAQDHPYCSSRLRPLPSKSPLATTQPRSRTPASCPVVQGPFSFLVQERPESREGPLHQEARSCPGSPTHHPFPSPAPPHSWSWDPTPSLRAVGSVHTKGNRQCPGPDGFPKHHAGGRRHKAVSSSVPGWLHAARQEQGLGDGLDFKHPVNKYNIMCVRSRARIRRPLPPRVVTGTPTSGSCAAERDCFPYLFSVLDYYWFECGAWVM